MRQNRVQSHGTPRGLDVDSIYSPPTVLIAVPEAFPKTVDFCLVVSFYVSKRTNTQYKIYMLTSTVSMDIFHAYNYKRLIIQSDGRITLSAMRSASRFGKDICLFTQ
jgi:hypothetical protein